MTIDNDDDNGHTRKCSHIKIHIIIILWIHWLFTLCVHVWNIIDIFFFSFKQQQQQQKYHLFFSVCEYNFQLSTTTTLILLLIFLF